MEAVAEKKRTFTYNPGDDTKGDDLILRVLRRVLFATPNQVHALLPPRALKVVRLRMQALESLGYTRSFKDPMSAFAPRGHTLALLGWSRLASIGATEPPASLNQNTLPRRNYEALSDIQTNKNFDHDRKLTDLYIQVKRQMEAAGWTLNTWERIAYYIRIGDKVPDVFIEFRTPEGVQGCAFVEFENTRQSSHEGRLSLFDKFDDYHGYVRSGDFEARWGYKVPRVITVQASDEMVSNQIARMENAGGIYKLPRWFFTVPGTDWTKAVFHSASGVLALDS